jgi:hypothetical protein
MGGADDYAANVDRNGRAPPRLQLVSRWHRPYTPPNWRRMSYPVIQMMNANRNTKPTM